MSSRLGRLLRGGGKGRESSRGLPRFRQLAAAAEVLESRMLLYSPSFTPTTTNLADHVNGPLADAGQNLVSLYIGYQAYSAAVGGSDFADSPENPLGTKLIELEGNSVGVDVRGQGTIQAFTSALGSLGMTVQNTDATTMTVEGLLPLADLPAVAEFAPTISVQPIYIPTAYSVGKAPDQAEMVSDAATAKTQYSVNGAGVTVGILSDSVNQYAGGLADSVASGDLPSNVDVLEDGDAGGTDEGRAMLEEIHDIATGSSLAFHTGEGGELNFAAGIDDLATEAGAQVIDDDIGYPDEPFFQPGVVAQAVTNVVQNDNVLYYSSAGNSSDSGYQSVFRAATGTVTGVGTGTFMNFDPNGGTALTLGINVYEQGSDGPVLQFDQPYYTSSGVTSDVDFYILDQNNNIVASGTDNNVAEQMPLQFSGSLAPGQYKVAVEVVSGPNPGRIEFHEPDDGGFSPDREYGSAGGTTYPSTSGHNASADAITVGALPWFDAAPYFTPSAGTDNDPYSSFGPVVEEFAADGSKLASPLVLDKPDITAADAITTSFFIPGQIIDTTQASDYEGPNPPYPGSPTTTFGWTSTPTNLNPLDLDTFTGTSAAAPNAAAIGALEKELNPSVTSAQILNAMEATASPLDGQVAGTWNPQAGYGSVNALATLTMLSVSLTVEPVTASQDVPLDDVEVAHFTDGQALPVADYSATINWGDGTTTGGLVVADPKGGYDILGSHTYTVGEDQTLKVALTSTGGADVSGSSTATVAGAPVTGTAYPISTTEGALFSGTVAEFFDSDPEATTPSDYSASISWGDGTTDTGELVGVPTIGGGATYQVDGSHAYEAGTYTVKVTVSTDNNSGVVLQTTATVTALPLTAQAVDVSVQEGTVFKGIVATFTDPDPLNPPLTAYSATINWGDGVTEAGSIIANPNGAGDAVVGDEYFSAGSFTATVTITSKSGSTVVVNPTVSVPDAPLSGGGAKFTGQEGVASPVQVATFVDADPVPHDGSHYTVSIAWGDGTSSAGTVIPDGQGGYLVYGAHAYAAGSFVDKVTITDAVGPGTPGGAQSTTINGVATISPSPLTATPAIISASAGSTFFGLIATFTTSATNLTAASFTAEITWGDGSTSAGTIQADPAGGFEVIGANTYADTGFYPVGVTITSKSGAQTTTTSDANVSAAPITAGALPIAGAERSTVGGMVAEFSTTDPTLGASNFVATIDWGDGETTQGTVGTVAGGGFSVSGTHAYGLSGTYPVTVSIASTEGAGTVATTSATIAFVPSPVVGGLVAADIASSTAVNVTNQTVPTFSGQALAGSTVTVLAQLVGTSGYAAIGTATVGPDGTWAVQSTQVLPTGEYNIFAQATDAGGVAGPVQQLLPGATSGPLVVDTTPAQVTGLALKGAQFQVGLAAGISGLNQATVLDPANYSVEYVASNGSVTPVAVTGVSVASGNPATGEQVDVAFGGGKKLKAGGYVLTIRSAGIEDNAGNTLVETYYVPYPAAYTAPGNNYQAEIVTNGKATSSPEQYVPPSAAAGAKAHEAFIRSHLRIQRALRRR